jgi:peptidyl-prolyl cis-trans isomerase C
MLFVTRTNLFLLIFFMISVPLVGSGLAEVSRETSDNPVAAKVNGRPIYFNELKPDIDDALARYKRSGVSSISDETKKRIQKQELARKVDFELLVQAGEKTLGSDIEQQVNERIKARQANDSKSDHSQKTTKGDLNNDAYRQHVKRQLLADEYLAKRGIQDLRVTEAEAKLYYEQNKQSFREAESVKVSHILIKLPKNPKPEEIAEARKEIERIRAEISAGKDFAEAAKQYSACASAKDGGDLGYINHGYMPKDFDTVAFSLKEGQVSDVVRTRHGFHLVKAFDKKPARIQEFVEVKEFIEKFLIKKVQANKTKEVVEELKREAKVEVYLK